METSLTTGAKKETFPPNEAAPTTWRLGFGRRALRISPLPTPEQVFGFRRLGWEERMLLLAGPGIIALGMAIGSNEWITAPRYAAQYGMQGLLWLLLVSIILQVFYNVELARYTLATGESPIIGFGRVWPGLGIWPAAALVCFYVAFILGSWTLSAGQSLYILIRGRSLTTEDMAVARQLGTILLMAVFMLLIFSRRMGRSLELILGTIAPYIIIGLLMVTAVVVPGDYWRLAVQATFVPSRPPVGVDFSHLGSLVGLTALAAGLNYAVTSYYRDKGYGMSYRSGSLTGMLAKEPAHLRPEGHTFAETSANAVVWKRWFRLILWDQWFIFFIGCLVGVFMPILLAVYLVNSGAVALPNDLSDVSFIAIGLGERFGQLVFSWALIIGFTVMIGAQVVVLELLTRSLTEVIYISSAQIRDLTRQDARKIYYPLMFLVVVSIAIMLNLSAAAPAQISLITGNIANLAGMIFPGLLLYLNHKLPRPARGPWWANLALLANMLFFGFFFINALSQWISGSPLVRF